MRKTLLALSVLPWSLAIGAIPSSAGAAASTGTVIQTGSIAGGDFLPGAFVTPIFLQEIDFRAPGKGNAAASTSGSVVCGADASPGNKVVDLATEILTARGTPDPTGAGGLRLATVLAPNTSQTFNLASTRVVASKKAGTESFYFEIHQLRMDAGTHCYYYGLAFTVVFAPSS